MKGNIMPKTASIRYASVWELLTKLLDLVGLFTAMYLSELLVDNIVFGGAIYIVGQVWVIYARIFNNDSIKRLPSSIRNRGVLIFIIAALLTAALVFFFPYLQSKITALVLIVLIAGFIAQEIVTDSLAKRLKWPMLRRALLLAGAHLLFLAGYIVFFLLNQWVVGYDVPREIGVVWLVAAGLSAILCVCQLMESPRTPPEPDGAAVDGDRLMDVHAYRVYNKMTVNTMLAINLSITAFICYMRFLPYSGFAHSILMLCIWIAFVAVIAVFFLWLLNKHYLSRHDRPAIFMAGLLCWVGAMLVTLGDAAWSNTLPGSFFGAALYSASIACMLSIILLQGYEMKTVIELGVGKIDQGAYARNTSVMMDWSALMSYLLILIMLTIASFIVDGRLDQIEAMEGMQQVMQGIMLVLPMFFVMAGLVYALLQPLDQHYAKKLRKYTRQQAEGKKDAPLEDRLKKILVNNYPKRLAILVLRPFIRPFLPCRVIGKDKVDTESGPVVFVCNHLELYGPIMAVLHSPFFFRPWVIQGMLDKEFISGQMQPGVDKIFGFLPQGFRRWLTNLVAPLLRWIMFATDPIPVYRGTVRGVIQTITLSAEAMAYDDNILIFPEVDYQESGVGEFFSGFVQVAKTYYRQTGKCATFYPMYVNKKKRTLTYEDGITFDPTNTNAIEKDRIVDYLQSVMNDMAAL